MNDSVKKDGVIFDEDCLTRAIDYMTYKPPSQQKVQEVRDNFREKYGKFKKAMDHYHNSEAYKKFIALANKEMEVEPDYELRTNKIQKYFDEHVRDSEAYKTYKPIRIAYEEAAILLYGL
jgi:hypothetical protein